MKIITDYFASPQAEYKKCNPPNIMTSKLPSDHNSMTEANNDVCYQTRKIKIRLADPNDPQSYVCEIYDTSVEDENASTTSKQEPEKSCAFNILMARNERECIASAPKKRSRRKQIVDVPETESSDDEALIIVKKKLKISSKSEKLQISDGIKSAVNNSADSLKASDLKSNETSSENSSSLPNVLQTRSFRKSDYNRNSQSINEPSLTTARKSSRYVPNQINKESLQTGKVKPLRKSEVSIENYFLPKKGSSKKGNSSSSVSVDDNITDSKGIFERSGDIKSLKENKDCIVVLEKISIPPMFLKNPKKPTIDSDVLKARQAFLQKGLPNVLKNKISKEKIEEKDPPHFPLISHVHQFCDNPLWKKRIIDISLKNIDIKYNPELHWKPCINISQVLQRFTLGRMKRASDIEGHLKNLNTIYKNVDISKLYSTLSTVKESHANNQMHLTWSNKYKLKSSEFLSNEQTVEKLRKWLRSWKNCVENVNTRAIVSMESSDEFVSSEDEDKKTNAPVTACLLQGSISSGKTALVQTIAAELDFHILEVNCSSKRSGKKMLADLQEATKSHKILQEADGNVGTSMKGEKIAMIVVEEADIIFDDHDDGFVSALQTLINSAKRPVLLLTSEPSVWHLEKFRSCNTLQLKLVRPQLTTSCAFLEMVALVEGTIIPRSTALKILSLNKCDLRQSLLELQFWIQHGTNNQTWPIIINQRFTTEAMWWLSHQLLFKNDLWHSDLSTLRKSGEIPLTLHEKSKKKAKCNELSLEKKYDYFENLSLCDMLEGNAVSSNLEINNFEMKIKDSSYLGENFSIDNYKQTTFKKELIEDILQRSLRVKIDDPNINLHNIPAKDKRWCTSQTKASAELSKLIPNKYTNEARYCDYLPTLREICRAEQNREVGNTKRSNRFYHYIKTLGGTPTSVNLNINCSVLFQKSNC